MKLEEKSFDRMMKELVQIEELMCGDEPEWVIRRKIIKILGTSGHYPIRAVFHRHRCGLRYL